TLSNQNLMGRLVYVREVSPAPTCSHPVPRTPANAPPQDREAEPRFTGPPPPRGDYGGRGGYGGGPGAGYGAGVGGPNAGRQLYVGNLPYTVGWQDLKDLFRQAGKPFPSLPLNALSHLQ
ncbi:hypothetical protein KEM52_004742, partial [Ascosphaera acerosa]